MWECPRCGQRSLIWQSDFMAEECGYMFNGIVTFFTCTNCGANVELSYELDDDDSEEQKEEEVTESGGDHQPDQSGD